MYELAHGVTLSSDKCVLHSCDNPRCVNPQHLFLGSKVDNMRDRDAKGRQARGEVAGNVKLTSREVRAIRLLYATREWSQEALGALFGVRQAAVSSVVRHDTWKHVAA